MTGLAYLGQIAMVEKRLIAAKKRMERYKADMDYVNHLSQTGKVSQTPDVTRNEAMMSKYMEAVDQVTALIQEKNAVIDRVEAKLMQMQTIMVLQCFGVFISNTDQLLRWQMNCTIPGKARISSGDRELRELDRILAAEEQTDRQQSAVAV